MARWWELTATSRRRTRATTVRLATPANITRHSTNNPHTRASLRCRDTRTTPTTPTLTSISTRGTAPTSMVTTGTDMPCPRNPDRDWNQIVSIHYKVQLPWRMNEAFYIKWILNPDDTFKICVHFKIIPNYFQTLLTAMLADCRIPTQDTTSQTSCSDRPGPWTAPPTPASASAATTPRTWGPWWVSTTRATPPPPAAWYGRSSCRHVRHVSCVITWHSCVQWSVRAPLVCDKKYCRNTYIAPILRTLKNVNNSSENNNSRIQSKSKY